MKLETKTQAAVNVPTFFMRISSTSIFSGNNQNLFMIVSSWWLRENT